MNSQRLTLYDVEWQILRVNLLKGNQKGGGGFTTPEGTKANITRLKTYLGKSPSVDKLWRVLNLLNAVRMGNSGQGKAGSDHDNAIKDYRDEVQVLYNKAEKKFSPPSESTIKVQLGHASTEELKKVAANLGMRNKLRGGPNRPELAWFLGILKTELDSRNPNV